MATSGTTTTQTGVETMTDGAYDYLHKPNDFPRLTTLANAVEKTAEIGQGIWNQAETRTGEWEMGIVGETAAMHEVFKLIGQLGNSDITTLITGESGTGKDLVARAIYKHGRRSQQPFLVVNCPAIPEELIESELFGHERGVFTGANARRVGKFEQCNHGTMFLDGVGDMTPAAQMKVLRVLQSGAFERVGGRRTIKVDVRVIAASKEPLEKAVAAKRFREDLFYRLNVMHVAIPPLRERHQDIPLLADHFLNKLAHEQQRLPKTLGPGVIGVLQRYIWPGNVRELENVIRRAVVLSDGESILVNDLPDEILNFDSLSQNALSAAIEDAIWDVAAVARHYFRWAKNESGTGVIDTVQRELMAQALRETEGNQTQAAKLLGITRAALRSQMARCNPRAN